MVKKSSIDLFLAILSVFFIIGVGSTIATQCGPPSNETITVHTVTSAEGPPDVDPLETRLYREIDEQAGVVCYGFNDKLGYPRAGTPIHCFLIKDTNLTAHPDSSQSGSR